MTEEHKLIELLEPDLDKQIRTLLEENGLDWQSIHLWVMMNGYVILSEEEFNELQSQRQEYDRTED